MARGFTLIEMLLTVALLGLVTGMALPVTRAVFVRDDLDIATVTVAQNLRRAAILAQSSDGDTAWGLSVQTGSITLFRGTSYAGRDASFDEVFEMPENITLSGTQEFVFAKFTGLPQATGSLALTSPNNETRTVTINAKGMVSY